MREPIFFLTNFFLLFYRPLRLPSDFSRIFGRAVGIQNFGNFVWTLLQKRTCILGDGTLAQRYYWKRYIEPEEGVRGELITATSMKAVSSLAAFRGWPYGQSNHRNLVLPTLVSANLLSLSLSLSHFITIAICLKFYSKFSTNILGRPLSRDEMSFSLPLSPPLFSIV